MNKWTTFVALAVVSLAALASPPHAAAQQDPANPPIMRPVISEEVAPLQTIAPVAQDGHRGEGFLRKPPGDGPFPAIVLIHGGLARHLTEWIREYALSTHPSRFLAAGYVVAVITYRSRDIDPNAQSPLTVQDAVAAVDYLKALPYVDPRSILVMGSSGGGDLALEVAAATEVAAIVAEEPASMLMAGVFTAAFMAEWRPGAGGAQEFVEAYRAHGDPQGLADKIARISSPVLIIQGDDGSPLNRFNAEVLIPELRAAGTSLKVITYPGEPHGFSFHSRPRSAVALKAFQDIDGFIRRYVETQPRAVDDSLVEHVPIAIEPERVAITVSSEILADYVGTYEFPPGVDNVVTLEDNRLMMEAPGFGKSQLFAESETEFFAENNRLEFVRGDDGIVTHLIFRGGGNEITVPRKSNDR